MSIQETKYDLLMERFWDEIKDTKCYIKDAEKMKDYCPETYKAFHTMAVSRLENAKTIKTMIDKMHTNYNMAMRENGSEETNEHCKAHYYKETPRLNMEILELGTKIKMMSI